MTHEEQSAGRPLRVLCMQCGVVCSAGADRVRKRPWATVRCCLCIGYNPVWCHICRRRTNQESMPAIIATIQRRRRGVQNP